MKYIITEDRLNKIFNTYMNLSYEGMKYNHNSREFLLPGRIVFGYLEKNHFYFADYSIETLLYNMFGENTNELLFQYLRTNFPEVPVFGVE
jgi:hypothetical protein